MHYTNTVTQCFSTNKSNVAEAEGGYEFEPTQPLSIQHDGLEPQQEGTVIPLLLIKSDVTDPC